MLRTLTFACFAVGLCTPVFADISVRFVEGAPKDRFVIEASDAFCSTDPLAVTVNLAESPGKLIFDVTDSGAGVEAFQPFEVVPGAESVLAASSVKDGDTLLRPDLAGLNDETSVAFTIDVDDTLGAREITVVDGEILGASVSVEVTGDEMTAAFDETAMAIVPWTICPS